MYIPNSAPAVSPSYTLKTQRRNEVVYDNLYCIYGEWRTTSKPEVTQRGQGGRVESQ